MRGVDDDALGGNAESDAHLIAQRERGLVRRDDMHRLAIDPDERCARLDVGLMHARHDEGVLEHAGGAREGRVDVTVLVLHLTLHVRMRDLVARTAEVHLFLRVGMHERGVAIERALGIEHGRQLFVLDRDQSRRLFGRLGRVRRDGRDAISDEARALPREHRPVLQPATEAMTAHVGSRDHRADAGDGARGAHVD